MTPPRTIAQYLDQLDRALPGPGRRRERIRSEIEDHLRSELERRTAGGQSEPEATTALLHAFGDVHTVAHGFAADRARGSAGGAARAVAAAVVAFAGLFVVTTQMQVESYPPLRGGAAAAVGWLAVQVAIVAAVVAGLRLAGTARRGRVTAGDLRLALRAEGVAAGAAGISVAVDAAAVAGGAPPPRILVAAVAATSAVALLALGRLALAGLDVRQLARMEGPEAEPISAIELLGASAVDLPARLEGHLPQPVAHALDRATARVGPLVGWALPRRRTAAAALASVAGAGLALASLREHLLGEGGELFPALAAAIVIFAIEAGAVVLAFYAFDRLLGLWPRRTDLSAGLR